MWLWLCTLTVANADDTLALDALPAPVIATLAHQWPTAHAVSAEREDNEIEVRMADGAREFEATLKADGTWIETEEKVDPAALPAPVRTALASHGTAVRAELHTLADGRTDYEVVVKGKGKNVELHVDAAGVIRADAKAHEDDEDEGEDEEDDDGHEGNEAGEHH